MPWKSINQKIINQKNFPQDSDLNNTPDSTQGETVNLNNLEDLPDLPHIITQNPPLKILIDSGASSSIINPEIAYKLFSNFIFPHEFEIKSVHRKSQGTHALTFSILRELGDNTPITFLILPWHSKYDCLIGHKDFKNFSTAKFEINYLNNIPEKCKAVSVNNNQDARSQIRTNHIVSQLLGIRATAGEKTYATVVFHQVNTNYEYR